MKTFDAAIVGAGPAGITCAIQLKRYGIDFCVFEKKKVGGLLNNANLIENYPGFPLGIKGNKLSWLMETQAKNLGIYFLPLNVKKISFNENTFEIETDKESFRSRFLVVASGTAPIKLPQAEELKKSNRIFYELIDIPNPCGLNIAIAGGGDAAFDYALGLSAWLNRVTLLVRGRKPSSLDLLIKRAKKHKYIDIRFNTEITDIIESDDSLLLRCRNGKADYDLQCDYLLPAIGRKPDLGFISNEDIEMLKNSNQIYFIGDVNNGLFRQAAIAAGDGMKAAMDIYSRLKGSKK